MAAKKTPPKGAKLVQGGFPVVGGCTLEAWQGVIAKRGLCELSKHNAFACYSVCDICPYGRVIAVTYAVTSVRNELSKYIWTCLLK